MANKHYTSLICALNLFPLTLYAASDMSAVYHSNQLALNAGVGYLRGESNEYVYDEETGWKYSQLNWKIKQAAIIKGKINYDLIDWLTANINGWITITKGQAVMDDYDWLNLNQSKWTDWSHHENTALDYANQIDINLEGWILQHHNYKVGVVAGYERNSLGFLAKGGCYQYNNGEFVGCFPNEEPGIGYQQVFRTVYLGVSGTYLINNFNIDAFFKYSPWVRSEDVDHHYLRDLTFKEYGNHSNFYSSGIMAGYFIKPNTKVFAEAAYTCFTNGKADTEIIQNDSGLYAYLNNAAGLSHKNYTLSIGIQFIPDLA